MPTIKRKSDFFDSEECAQLKAELQRMAADIGHTTNSSYSANTSVYPDNTISFVDKHIKYVSEHPNVNLDQYLSNLRLITRVR
jgi:hypothetical protein